MKSTSVIHVDGQKQIYTYHYPDKYRDNEEAQLRFLWAQLQNEYRQKEDGNMNVIASRTFKWVKT